MVILVSVPIRGLLNLTLKELSYGTQTTTSSSFRPHQGIIEFNGTITQMPITIAGINAVSVPIRGLLNLTLSTEVTKKGFPSIWFPSPSGDY